MNYWEKLGLLMDHMDINEFKGTEEDEDILVEAYMKAAESEEDSNDFEFNAEEKECIDRCLKENELEPDGEEE